MTIHIVILALVLLAGIMLYRKKITSKKFLRVAFGAMGLVLGFRGQNVGEDTAHFIDVFEKLDKVTWITVLTSGTDVIYETVSGVNWKADLKVEVGYAVLNKLIHAFTSNAQWLIIAVAIATCYLMGKFIYDNCLDVFMPTFIILCESFYMNSFNLMRQMLAISIGLQAYTILKKGGEHLIWRAVIVIMAACLFHKTALVLLLLIPLWVCKNPQKTIKYIIPICALIPLLIVQGSAIVIYIIPKYAAYFSNNYWQSDFSGIIVLWIIEVFIVLIILGQYENKDGKTAFVATTCTILYIAFEIASLKIVAFTRIALYFRAFLVFLLPYFERYLKPNSRGIYRAVMIVLLTALYLSYASSPTRIYTFFWQ